VLPADAVVVEESGELLLRRVREFHARVSGAGSSDQARALRYRAAAVLGDGGEGRCQSDEADCTLAFESPPGGLMGTPAQRMVAEQLRPHGVIDGRVLQAMASVPREEFLAPRMRRHAYEDRALAIECGQTISQPLVVALMIQAAAPRPDGIALEVGTGSGYAAAVLSRLCRKLFPVEREPALAEHASETLRRLGFDNVE